MKAGAKLDGMPVNLTWKPDQFGHECAVSNYLSLRVDQEYEGVRYHASVLLGVYRGGFLYCSRRTFTFEEAKAVCIREGIKQAIRLSRIHAETAELLKRARASSEVAR